MADGAADVCICVLFYGAEDTHFKLAQRVLNAPLRCLAKRNIEFRFGCNAVGEDTARLLAQQVTEHFHGAALFQSLENIMKYPMMRQMFHAAPIRAPVTLWLDHDSYLALDESDNVDDWLDRVIKQVNGCNLLGSIQKAKLSEEQLAWATQQPWFKSDLSALYLSYPLGGWWAIKTELIYRFDWPPPSFQQKGGDVLLGALFKHHNLPFCHFRNGVRVTANNAGVESAMAVTIES